MNELLQVKEQLTLEIREAHYKCREQLIEFVLNPPKEDVLLEKLRNELATTLRSLDASMRELYEVVNPEMPIDPSSIHLLMKYIDWKAKYLGAQSGVGIYSPDEVVLTESIDEADTLKRKRLFRTGFPGAPEYLNHWHRVYECPSELDETQTTFCGPGDNHTFINWADLMAWYVGLPLNAYQTTTLEVQDSRYSGGIVYDYGINPLEENKFALRISYAKNGEMQFYE